MGVLLACGAGGRAGAGEICFADGRREAVQEPRQDSKGEWTALREGRRTILHPGDVVVIVDDAGKTNVTIPSVAPPPDPPETQAALEMVRDLGNDAWLAAAEQLARHPSAAVHDALAAMAADANRERRERAVHSLARLRTREAVTAAARAVLGEKDRALRRRLASVLFSVQEIFRRSPAVELVDEGVADRDVLVRLIFAELSPLDHEAATAVLRKDGLKHADHHVRESAALELGQRGDPAGEPLLIQMLARTRLPGFEDDDALHERLLAQEQVAICEILGRLGSEKGRAALDKATRSRIEAVRMAAAAALKAMDG